MNDASWRLLLRQYDQSILTMFAGVAAFVFNWHAWPDERVHRIMTLVPLIACPIILCLEFVK